MPTPEIASRATRHLRKSDPIMANVIKSVGPCPLRPRPVNFENLVWIISCQMLSGAVAEVIFKRVKALADGPGVLTPAKLKSVTDKQLRAAGMSRAKVAAIRDLIARIDSGDLRLRALRNMSNDDIIAAITRVKGLGLWSAQMLLMFSMVRPDIFPTGDLGIRQAMSRLYGLDDPAAMIEHAERWRPWRTYASWYLWQAITNDIAPPTD